MKRQRPYILRPSSSKNQQNKAWGNTNDEEQQTPYSKHGNNSRKHARVLRPDLTTNDFSRILPRKMYKDKERLYSQGLQLKQAFNEVSAENVKLKTQLSMIEKQQHRLSRLNQSVEGSKLHNHSNVLANKSHIRDIKNSGYKRLIKDIRAQNNYLLTENNKIKKSLKYIKTNQLEVQLKIVIDENKKLASILEQYAQKLNENERNDADFEEIQIALQREYEANKGLSEQNQRLVQELEDLEARLKSELERWKIKENKLNREITLARKKDIENMRYIQDLRKELKKLGETNMKESRKRNSKSAYRGTGHQSKDSKGLVLEKQQIVVNLSDETKQKLNQENLTLQNEVKALRQELDALNRQLLQQRQNKPNNLSPDESQKVADSKLMVSKLRITNDKKSVQKQSDVKVDFSYDYDEFQPQVQLQGSKGKEEYVTGDILKIKEDFEGPDEEEFLFKKEEEEDTKEKKNRAKSGKKNKKGFKPNKAVLSEIKQILTYRMKSQRYPFSDLKSDIQASQEPAFKCIELMQMLENEPFYLKKDHIEIFLNYCYDKTKIEPNEPLDNKIFVDKIRKVVDDFQLMSQEKEKQMIIKIAEMTSNYPDELQLAFQNIKNSEQTVSKEKLTQMFKKLQLEDEYIQLIIAQLSLCSDDLQHLNFYGFFQRFYIGQYEEEEPQIEAIKQQSQESPPNSSRAKKDGKKNKDSKRSSDRL